MEHTALKMEKLDFILIGLMRRYQEKVQDVSKIIGLMLEEKIINDPSEIENDHIAFRTMGVPHLGIASLEKIFLHYGYTKMDHYHFEGKKLDAYWYSPARDTDPRIFISELRVHELSDQSQQIIRSYTDELTSDPVGQLDLDDAMAVDQFLNQPLWRTPSLADYDALLQESEYAAWVIFNRYYLNHFTISVHNLGLEYKTIEAFNAFLEKHGVKLNTAGGKIKTSPDGGLIQSATVAQMIEATFSNGEKKSIAGSYVEFAERRILPHLADIPLTVIERRHRREGFEASNADKIFESTYISQTKK